MRVRNLFLAISLVTSLCLGQALLSRPATAASLLPEGGGDICNNITSPDKPSACTTNTDPSKPAPPVPDPITGPNGIILRVANLLAFIAGVFAVFVIVVSGIRYMMSSGDSARINTAKNAILFSAIGIVIVASANTIVRFIVSKL